MMENTETELDKSESDRAKEQQSPSKPPSDSQSPAERHEEITSESDEYLTQQSCRTQQSDYFKLLEEMCQSNKLPLSLECLLHNLYHKEVKSPAEFLIAVVYYLTLESGFVPTSLPAEMKSKIRTHWGFSFVAQIPDYSWKFVADEIVRQHQRLQNNEAAAPITGRMEEIYDFKLNLLQHSDDEMQLIIRKVFGGAALCITFCLSRQEEATSVILPVNEFINVNEPLNIELIRMNPQFFFKNIQKLIETVKQNLIAPLRNVVMYESGYPNAALHGMPKEALWTLFGYLRPDLETLQKVSQTCVYLRNMAISFLNESNIRLKHRRPTPIIYDPLNNINPHSRYRISNGIPGLLLGRYEYFPHINFWSRSNPLHFRI